MRYDVHIRIESEGLAYVETVTAPCPSIATAIALDKLNAEGIPATVGDVTHVGEHVEITDDLLAAEGWI